MKSTLSIASLGIVPLILTGCCGAYQQRIKKLEHDENTLKASLIECESKNNKAIAYSKLLEDELMKLGVDKSDLDEKYNNAEAAIRSMREEIDAVEKRLAQSTARLHETSRELEANQRLLDEFRLRQTLAMARMETLKQMLSKFKELIDAGKLKVLVRNGRLLIELPSAVLFESGQADISDEGEETLTTVAEVLSSITDREFQVSGHTDNAPKKRMKFKDNWELSGARSLAVVRYLEENGVSSATLSGAGYSEHQPVANNLGEDGMAQNRRIEIALMPNLSELPDLSDLEAVLR